MVQTRRCRLQFPEGSATTNTPPAAEPNPTPAAAPPVSFGFCLGFSFRKRGGPCGRIAPPSRVTSALESVVCLRPLRHQSGGKRSPEVGTTPEATEKGLMDISIYSRLPTVSHFRMFWLVLYSHHVLEHCGYQEKPV